MKNIIEVLTLKFKTMITEKENATDKWICPHCEKEGVFHIIEDAILKDDWREILCGCGNCDELFIRKYKFVEVVKLERKPK